MDETGISCRALPDKSLTVHGTDCHEGKHSKEWLTAVFCISMTGDFIKTIVIGKSQKPHCFKNINPSLLPVMWQIIRRLR